MRVTLQTGQTCSTVSDDRDGRGGVQCEGGEGDDEDRRFILSFSIVFKPARPLRVPLLRKREMSFNL